MNVQKNDCVILHKELKNWIKSKLQDFQKKHQEEDDVVRAENRSNKEGVLVQFVAKAPSKPKVHPVIFEIQNLNLDEFTGKQALEKLYDFQSQIEN
jgi:hypothetical protein